MIKLLFKTAIIFSLCPVLISACSSNKNVQLINPVFLTRISDSGLKHFQIQTQRTRNEQQSLRQRPQRRGESGPQSPRSQNKQFKNIQKQLHQNAELKIQQTQFCRTGFWVLNTEADAARPFLRGECNEKATEADRAQFPATLLRW